MTLMLKHPERAPNPDVGLVMDAARALDVREFDIFLLAWRFWHRSEPDLARLEQAFATYMFNQQIPAWVRHLAREVLRREAAGTLYPGAFGANRLRETPTPIRHGGAYVAGVMALAVMFVALLILHRPNAEAATSLVCGAGPGGAYVEQVARMFTSKTDPFRCER